MSDASVGYDAAEEFLDRQSAIQRVQRILHSYPWLSPAIVLAITVIVFRLLTSKFATPTDLGVIAQQTAVVGTLAIGQTLIILTAGIDLSCGAIMVFSSMVMGKTAFDQGVPGWAALIIGVIVGGLAGLFNGLLITRAKLPPFIVTLGSLGIFTSLTLLYATGRTVRNTELAPELKWLGHSMDLGGFRVTSGVLLMLAMYAVLAYVLRYTAWGTHVYAVGDDPDAARLAGIQNSRVIVSVYVVAGVIFAIAGWVLIGRISAASPNSGVDANLDSITAVVIGGTSLFGGRGRVIGSLIGALIVTSVDHGLSVAGLDQYYKQLAIGCLIIVAVTADQWIRRARA
ncbi:MAG: fructose transport system permease protein [Ilumatobacteraceae bacterium]|nr:fructose transport system permease protein [Ilumatobacteraceae bacterium]